MTEEELNEYTDYIVEILNDGGKGTAMVLDACQEWINSNGMGYKSVFNKLSSRGLKMDFNTFSKKVDKRSEARYKMQAKAAKKVLFR